jgi:D-alanyl-D-alanine carboxypeptidase
MRIPNRPGIVIAGLLLMAACRPSVDGPPGPEARLQALVEAAVAGEEDRLGAAMHVDAPGIGLSWEGAAGAADPGAGTAMTPSTPILVASNTKTFVAAAILKLHEDARLDVDDAISNYLPNAYLEMLRGDGYDPDALTIRHLLTHTGGLFDFADSDIYTEAILADPGHRWTRTEQLEGAMEWGDPYGLPGEVYRYCDTGYILLGEILERITGAGMPDAVRELVGYEKLGLGSTWFESLEPRPSGVPDLAHQFWMGIDVTTIDPSQDLYGGGGLASTVGDLAGFMRAVFTGAVFENPATLGEMLAAVDVQRAGPDYFGSALTLGEYRMGVVVTEVNGYTVYRHGGFFGTTALYVPSLDLALGVSVNRVESEDRQQAVVEGAITVVAETRQSM